jgi:hypothetical protein
MRALLVCASADAPFTTVGSIFTMTCEQCGARLMLALSGQRFLQKHPEALLICMTCWLSGDAKDTPGDVLTTEGEVAKSLSEVAWYEIKPNLRRTRN